jgi:organic hydroperoxide reductase OsmC/OhrA
MVVGERLPDLPLAPPKEYDGPGDKWSPEHLLLASVAACFVFTFRAVARAWSIDVTDVSVIATGTVSRQNGVTRFSEIVIRPRMAVPLSTDRTRLLEAIDNAEDSCLISASLATPVRIEPELTDAAADDVPLQVPIAVEPRATSAASASRCPTPA